MNISAGTWEILADGEDSWLWEHPQTAAEADDM